MLAIHPSVPAVSVKEFLAWAKAQGGRVSFGSVSPGTVSHFLSALMNSEYGTAMTHIPYRGTGQVLPDLLGNRVQAGWLSAEPVRGLLEQGKLRALAVSASARTSVLPSVPSVLELGLPLLEAYAWSGLVASARAPAPIVRQLALDVGRALVAPEVTARVNDLGMHVTGGTTQDFVVKIARERDRWGRVVRDTGFSSQQ